MSAAGINAMFMMEGLVEGPYRDGARYDDVLSAWDRGCVELVFELELYGESAELTLESQPLQEFPGVFEYEVMVPFGAWFGQYVLDHPRTRPSREEAEAKLRDLIEAFFAQGGLPVTPAFMIDYNNPPSHAGMPGTLTRATARVGMLVHSALHFSNDRPVFIIDRLNDDGATMCLHFENRDGIVDTGCTPINRMYPTQAETLRAVIPMTLGEP